MFDAIKNAFDEMNGEEVENQVPRTPELQRLEDEMDRIRSSYNRKAELDEMNDIQSNI